MEFPPSDCLWSVQEESNNPNTMNELCISSARYQRKDRHGKRYTKKKKPQRDRAQEANSKPAWVLASCWEQGGGGEWERCWLAPSSSGPPSWENCPPLGTRQVLGEGALRLQEEGLCHGQVLTSWQTWFVWALGRNKYHLAGWALRIFYIMKGCRGWDFLCH